MLVVVCFILWFGIAAGQGQSNGQGNVNCDMCGQGNGNR